MMSQMGGVTRNGIQILNKMKSDGRGVQQRAAAAKEYLRQLK
jgi:hypothetical protein